MCLKPSIGKMAEQTKYELKQFEILIINLTNQKYEKDSIFTGSSALWTGPGVCSRRSEVKEDTEVLLTKENINAQDYLSVTTDNWQTGKTYGDVTGDFYNMSKTDRKLTLKVKNVSKAEVFVYNSNPDRGYTVTIGDAEAVEVPHGGTGLESKEFDTPKGEFSIVLAGTGSSVYPTKIKLTYAPEEQGGGAGGTVLYKKISSNNELETGEYLIVCEGQNVAFDGSLETLDAVNDIIQVTISDNTLHLMKRPMLLRLRLTLQPDTLRASPVSISAVPTALQAPAMA